MNKFNQGNLEVIMNMKMKAHYTRSLFILLLCVEIFGVTALVTPQKAHADSDSFSPVTILAVVAGACAYARYTYSKNRDTELKKSIEQLEYNYSPENGTRALYVHNWHAHNVNNAELARIMIADLYKTQQLSVFCKNGTSVILTHPCLKELIIALEEHNDYLASLIAHNERLITPQPTPIRDAQDQEESYAVKMKKILKWVRYFLLDS